MKRRHMIQYLASKRRKLTKDLVNRTKTGKIAFFMFFSRKKATGRTDRRINGQQMEKLDKTDINMNRVNSFVKRKFVTTETHKKIENFAEENENLAPKLKNLTTKSNFKLSSDPTDTAAEYMKETHKVESGIINTKYKVDMALLNQILEAVQQSSKDIAQIKEQNKKIEQIQNELNKLKSKDDNVKGQKGQKVQKETDKDIPQLNQLIELLNNLDKKVDGILSKEISFEGIYTALNNHYEQIQASHDSVLEAVKLLPTESVISKLAESISNYNSDMLLAKAAIEETINKLSNINEDVKNTLKNFSDKFVDEAVAKFNEGANKLTQNFQTIADDLCGKFGDFKKDGPDPAAGAVKIEDLNKLKEEVINAINEIKKSQQPDPKILNSNEEFLKNIQNQIDQMKIKVDNITVTIEEDKITEYVDRIAAELYNNISNDLKKEWLEVFDNILQKTQDIDSKINISGELEQFINKVNETIKNLATEKSTTEILTKLQSTDLGVAKTNQELAIILNKINKLEGTFQLLDQDLLYGFKEIQKNIGYLSEENKKDLELIANLIENHNHFSIETFKQMYNDLGINFKKELDMCNLMAEYRFGYLNSAVQQIAIEHRQQHADLHQLLGEIYGTVQGVAVNIQEQINNAVNYLEHSVQSSSTMISQEILRNREMIEHLCVVVQDNIDYLLNNFIESHEQLTEDIIRVTERSFFHYYLTVGHDISKINESLEQHNQQMKAYIEGAANNVNKMLKKLGIYSEQLIKELQMIREMSNQVKDESVMYDKKVDVNLTMPKWYDFLYPLRKRKKLHYLKTSKFSMDVKEVSMLDPAKPIGDVMEIPYLEEGKTYLTEVVPHSEAKIPDDIVLKKIAADNTSHTTIVFDAVEHVSQKMIDEIIRPLRIGNDIILLNPLDKPITGSPEYNLNLEEREKLYEKNEFVRNMAKTIFHYLNSFPEIPSDVAENKLLKALGDNDRPNFYAVYKGKILPINYGTAGRFVFHLGVVVNGIRNVFRRKHAFDRKYPDYVHQLPVMVKFGNYPQEQINENLSLEEIGGANMEMAFYDKDYHRNMNNVYMAYVICILACMVAFVAYGTMMHVYSVLHKATKLSPEQFTKVMNMAAEENDTNTRQMVNLFTKKRFISMDVMQFIIEKVNNRKTEAAYQLDLTKNHFATVERKTIRLIGTA